MRKIKISIFLKVFFINALMLSAVSFITLNKTELHFESESLKREEEVTLSKVNSKAQEVDDILQSYMDKIRFYSLYLLQNMQDRHESTILNDIVKNEHELVKLNIIIRDKTKEDIGNITKNDIIEKYEVSPTYFENIDNEMKPYLDNALNGEIQIKNVSRPDGIPLLWIALPLIKNSNNEVVSIASAYLRLEKIQNSFLADDQQLTFLVTSSGQILAHPDESLTLNSHDFSSNRIVKEAIEHKLRLLNKMYQINENKVMAAFAKTKFGFVVISQIDMNKVMSPIIFIKQQSTYILAIILSCSVLLIGIFSQTITRPVEKLLNYTKRIAAGEFDLHIAKKIRTSDEVGSLAHAFDQMTIGLKERDKIKTVLNKFHGSAVADDMISREITRHASRKKATIFFSDIRSFTKMSESQTAEETVEMLNEYFELMVGIINKHNGIVDKFVGDAIMAVWGVPSASGQDTINALNACLEMRVALNVLNQKRISEDKLPLMIGMGLHSGEVVSGTIGSEERMEYTVIGDAVNTASRIESSTKSFGTDLLVSEAIFEEVEKSFVFKEAGKVEAKGKSKPLSLLYVDGRIGENGVPQIIRTPYSHYEAHEGEEGKTKKVAA